MRAKSKGIAQRHAKIAGQYQTAGGVKLQIVSKEDGRLVYSFPELPDETLVPYKGLKIRALGFSDVVFEFVLDNGEMMAVQRASNAIVDDIGSPFSRMSLAHPTKAPHSPTLRICHT